MRGYGAILSARMRVLLQYRAAALAGLVTQLFFGFVRLMAFRGFYASTDVPQPISLEDVTTYVWLTQALLLLLPFRLDRDIDQMIRTGNVAYELIRPLDLYRVWFVRNVAARVVPAALRAVPMVLVAVPFLGMALPASWGAGLMTLLSLGLALWVSAAIAAILSIAMMWTLAGDGFQRLANAVAWLFAGAIVPLPLFPDWMQGLLNWLPYRAIMDTPFRIYMGQMAKAEVGWALLHQLVWAVALILFGRWLLGRGLDRLVVQGG